MENNLCFIIDNNELYLEKNLVDFDIPIFYTCVDKEKDKYVVLCVDSEELRYIVAKSEIRCILNMLDRKITMRQVFEKAIYLWEVSTGENCYLDEIKNISFGEINSDDLPIEDSFYEIPSKDVEEYYEILEEENKKKNFFINSYRCNYLQSNEIKSNFFEYDSQINVYNSIPEYERSKEKQYLSFFYDDSHEKRLSWTLNEDFQKFNKSKRKTYLREVVCCE